MIHVEFYRDTKNGSVQMEMQGHAETAPKGQDLVCAAASALAETLAQAVERLYYQGMLRRCPRVELEEGRAEIIVQPVQFLYEQDRLLEKPVIQIVDGYAHIQVYPRKCALAETLMTFWVAQAGAFVLERNFPRAVSLMAMEASA